MKLNVNHHRCTKEPQALIPLVSHQTCNPCPQSPGRPSPFGNVNYRRPNLSTVHFKYLAGKEHYLSVILKELTIQSRQKYCWICSTKWQRHGHDSSFCKRCDLTTILTEENAHNSLNKQQCTSQHLQPGPGENVAHPQTLSMLEFCFWSVYKATGVSLLKLCLEFSPYLKERHQSIFYLAVIKPVMLFLSPTWSFCSKELLERVLAF